METCLSPVLVFQRFRSPLRKGLVDDCRHLQRRLRRSKVRDARPDESLSDRLLESLHAQEAEGAGPVPALATDDSRAMAVS